MTTKRGSAAEQSVDRHYALHMSHENDADWICPACGPSEKTLSAVEFWKSSMRWSDKMNEKEACEFAEAYNAALRSQLEDAQRELGRMFVEKEGWKLQVGKAERDPATAQARIVRLTEVLRELDPGNVQPPYDHDGECSYCGVKEGYKHPKDCSWRKAEQALAELQSGEK